MKKIITILVTVIMLLSSITVFAADDSINNIAEETLTEYKNPGSLSLDSLTDILPFEDLYDKIGNWISEAVQFVYEHNIMTGLTRLNFGISEPLSRAQFAMILYRIENPADQSYVRIFPDVKESDWFGIPVSWCHETGVITGYQSGMFGPADPISREQLATMLYRYAKYNGYDTEIKEELDRFEDAGNVSDWAMEAVQWAVGNGIIKGKNNGTQIDPTGNTSRAECAVMVMRFMKKYAGAGADYSEEDEDEIVIPDYVENMSKEDEALLLGEMKDGVYTNQYFGYSFTAPEGWTMMLSNTGETTTVLSMPSLVSTYEDGYNGIYIDCEEDFSNRFTVYITNLKEDEEGKSEEELVDSHIKTMNEVTAALGDEPDYKKEYYMLGGEKHPAAVALNSEGKVRYIGFSIPNGHFNCMIDFYGTEVPLESLLPCVEKI